MKKNLFLLFTWPLSLSLIAQINPINFGESSLSGGSMLIDDDERVVIGNLNTPYLSAPFARGLTVFKLNIEDTDTTDYVGYYYFELEDYIYSEDIENFSIVHASRYVLDNDYGLEFLISYERETDTSVYDPLNYNADKYFATFAVNEDGSLLYNFGAQTGASIEWHNNNTYLKFRKKLKLEDGEYKVSYYTNYYALPGTLPCETTSCSSGGLVGEENPSPARLGNTLSPFDIYPNPVENILKIKLNDPSFSGTALTFSIYDMEGSLVWENAQTSLNSKFVELDISTLGNATYSLEVRSEYGGVYNGTFIKQ